MKPSITFSIVLPVHNGEPYLVETLEKILGQTYPYFNVFILENASTDRTLDIIQAYADERVVVYRSDRLLSIEENWARIIDLSLRPYLALFCHDDPPDIQFLEEIVRLIDLEPEASLYHTHVNVIDQTGQLISTSSPIPFIESADEFLFAFNSNQRNVTGSGFVMRSEDYQRLGGIAPMYKLHFADVLLYYAAAGLAYKVCSPRVLCNYRSFAQSAGQQANVTDAILAGKAYMQALRQTTHFAREADVRHRAAQGYISHFVALKYGACLRRDLIEDQGEVNRCRDQLGPIHDDPDFDLKIIYNRKNRFYQFIMALPSRALRRAVFNTAKRFRQLFLSMKGVHAIP